MKEINAIVAAYAALDPAQQRCALATVVRVEGSSYRRIGARMLVVDDGQWVGGISGGCLEGDALRRARLAIHQGRPVRMVYDTTEDDPYQLGVNLGCNGVIEVLFTPIDPSDPQNPIACLQALRDTRQPEILFTVLDTPPAATPAMGSAFAIGGSSWESLPTGLQEALPVSAAQALECRKSQQLHLDGWRLLVEFIAPPIHLAIFGGNYDVVSLARLAQELGWLVTIIGPVTKLPKVLFELAHQVLDKGSIPLLDASTAVVLMTHDYPTDLQILTKLAAHWPAYLGILGPRQRAERLLAALAEQAIYPPPAQLFAPIGLDLGALSPEEISLAIAAEVQAYFAGKEPVFLRTKPGVIHDREV